MSSGSYANYKAVAGANWPQRIPAHWEVRKLGHLALLKSGENITSEEIGETGQYPVYGGNGKRGYTDRYTHDGEFVLMGRQGALCGNINYATGRFWASEHAVVVKPLRWFATKWMGELLRAMNLNQYSISAAQPGLAVATISALRIPVPPLDEQRTIADFLDRETAIIDDLIAKKEQLLVLLQSRQDAVVRQLVVGQDLDVPKRRSGYSWLGDVPAHWKVLALKRIAKRVVVGIAEASTHAYADAGVPLVRTTNVKANRIDTSDLLYINKEFADKNRSKYMRAGDLVTARTGNPGISGVIPTELDGSQCFTMLITTLREDHVPEFFCYYINSEPARTYFALEGWGTAQINISVPILQMLPTPCPPEKEQRQIAEKIKRSMEASEGQLNLIRDAIERLREYRSSLISAAVTGQIDVRNYRPQEATALCQ